MPSQGDAAAAVELEDPPGHVVEEIAVVGDRHHGALVVLQEAFEPGHRLGVEVVGGLVEQQQIGLREQQPAERHPAALAARERAHVGLAGRTTQGIHGNVDGAPDVPAVGGIDLFLELGLLGQQGIHLAVLELLAEARRDRLETIEQRRNLADPLHDVAEHIEAGVELGLLGQEADGHAVGRPGLAVDVGLEPGHDAQQGRLARAVEAQYADLGARQEGQGNVAQHLLAAWEDLVQAPHHIDVLIAGHGRLRRSGGGARFYRKPGGAATTELVDGRGTGRPWGRRRAGSPARRRCRRLRLGSGRRLRRPYRCAPSRGTWR